MDFDKYLAEKLEIKLQNKQRIQFCSQFKDILELINGILGSPSAKEISISQDLYLINNLLDECRALSSKQSLIGLDKLMSPAICQIKRTLDKTKQKLESIAKEMSSATSPVPTGDALVESSTRSAEISKVNELEYEVLSLERRLQLKPAGEKPQSFKAIGIVGTCGVGKTALAQDLFNKQEVKDCFLPRIWVCISHLQNETQDRDATRRAIAKNILFHLGVDGEIIQSVEDLSKLIYALHLQLRGKRYLVVLDDAWPEDPWFENLDSCLPCDGNWRDKLAYGFPKGSGGRVIFTSRSSAFASVMTAQENLHFVHSLSDPVRGIPLTAKRMAQVYVLQLLKQKQERHGQSQGSADEDGGNQVPT